jgi:hypothetical protein
MSMYSSLDGIIYKAGIKIHLENDHVIYDDLKDEVLDSDILIPNGICSIQSKEITKLIVPKVVYFLYLKSPENAHL